LAFNKEEIKLYGTIVRDYVEKRRPAEDIRDELDIGFRIKGQSIEIFEIRPRFFDPGQKMEEPVAKTTYVRTKDIWKVFWMRQDLKWHGYDPQPEVPSLIGFLKIIDDDALGCFWG